MSEINHQSLYAVSANLKIDAELGRRRAGRQDRECRLARPGSALPSRISTMRSAVNREAPPATSRSTSVERSSRLVAVWETSSQIFSGLPLIVPPCPVRLEHAPAVAGRMLDLAVLGADDGDVRRLRTLRPLAGHELDR